MMDGDTADYEPVAICPEESPWRRSVIACSNGASKTLVSIKYEYRKQQVTR